MALQKSRKEIKKKHKNEILTFISKKIEDGKATTNQEIVRNTSIKSGTTVAKLVKELREDPSHESTIKTWERLKREPKFNLNNDYTRKKALNIINQQPTEELKNQKILELIKEPKLRAVMEQLIKNNKKGKVCSKKEIMDKTAVAKSTVSFYFKKYLNDEVLGPILKKREELKEKQFFDPHNKYSLEEVNKWEEAYKKTPNVHKVGKQFGIPHSVIHRYLSKRDVIQKGLLSEEEIKSAIEMYEKGSSLREVGNEFGVTETAILYHLRKAGVESHGFADWIRKEIKIPEKFSENMGKLVALIMTEGHMEEKCVRITNTSKPIIDEFKNLMSSTFGLTNFTESIDDDGNPNHRPRINCKVSSIELVKYLSQFINKKDYENARLPKEIFQLSDKEKCQALKYAYSGDGSVALTPYERKKYGRWNIRKNITLACSSNKLQKDWSNLISSVDIHNYISGNIIVISREENIVKFHKKIGFLNGIHVMKNTTWENFTRQEVLEALIKSYVNSQRGFISRDDAIKYLKSLF